MRGFRKLWLLKRNVFFNTRNHKLSYVKQLSADSEVTDVMCRINLNGFCIYFQGESALLASRLPVLYI